MGDLNRLVRDTDELARHWETSPYVAGGLGDLSDVFGVREVERLIHTAALPQDSVRLFRSGTEIPAGRVSRHRERGGARRERLVDGAAVERQVAAGATLVMEELQTYSAPIAALCREVTQETGCHTYSAGFVTPAGGRGVARHYDTHSVLIRQVHGSKRWRIGAPALRWPLTEPPAGNAGDAEAADGPPDVLDVVLRDGQCLYVPRGFTHVGDATEEASVHLSVALRPVPWGSVLRGLLDEALRDEPLRESLPYGFHRLDAREFEAMLTARAETLRAGLAERTAAGRGAPLLDRLRADARHAAPATGGLLAALTAPQPLESP